MNQDVLEKAKKIKLLILDVDGVLTNGQLHYTPSGETLKTFHVHDGFGIKQLMKRASIPVAIISARNLPMVELRLRELGITFIYQGYETKSVPYNSLIKQLHFSDEEVAYVGDDFPDLPIITRVGLGIAVANAHDTVQQKADWITTKAGGCGAVREVCDLLLQAQNHWDDLISDFHECGFANAT